jgi:5,10-methylenetetrahydromethanopterin reductase
MRFGLRLLTMAGGLRELVRWAQLAEEAGFDQVWLPSDPFMESAQVLAIAVAEHTSTVGVGVMFSPYSIDPSELATYAATLDLLTEGRALICIGFHSTDMCSWTGQDPSDATARIRSTVELFRALLRGEVAQSAGPIFHWTDECYLRFTPFRESIPIYVAAFGSELLALSGEIGDGSVPRLFPPEAASEIIPSIQHGAKDAGRDLSEVDIAGCVWVSVSTDHQRAAETLRPMISYFGPYFEDSTLSKIGLSARDFDGIRKLLADRRPAEAAAAVTDQMLRLAIVGTPDDVIERIEELSRQGVTQINIGGSLGPNPEEAIALLGKYVIPHFN